MTTSRACQWCGRQTTSQRGVCTGCRGLDQRGTDVQGNHALIGGRWVPRGGIVIWRAS